MRIPRTPSLALLVLALGAACSEQADPGPREGERPKNVILFVIDTLRADRLGTYGNDTQPSPHLDAFAAENVLFENFYAPSPYTATSHASLFTSVHPSTHGIWNRQRLASRDGDVFPALPKDAVTLAEVLQESGFQTAAIAGGGYVNERRGLAQGFDLFDSRTFGAKDRMDRALRWLEEERKEDSPFFMFLHTYQVHYPYFPDDETIDRFDAEYQGPLRDAVRGARDFAAEYLKKNPTKSPIGPVQKQFFKPLFEADEFSDRDKEFVFALYDAEINIVDREFARLRAWLEESGHAEDTMIVITSDHGEELWEHGYFGHHRVWEEVMHIPLLVSVPGGPSGVRRQDSGDLLDLMPTILGELDLELPDSCQGLDLQVHDPHPDLGPREHVHMANWPEAREARRFGNEKVHVYPGSDTHAQCFDLESDPHETKDLADTSGGKKIIAEFETQLAEFHRRSEKVRKQFGLFPVYHSLGSFTPEMRAELEGLGYLADDE